MRVRPDIGALPPLDKSNGTAAPPVKSKKPTTTHSITKEQPIFRRFEFVGGNSAKFWEIRVAGDEVTVRYGRLGTDGQSQTKTLPDAAAATKHAEKLIAQKTGKGYQEVTRAA